MFSQLDKKDTCVNFTVERWYPVANMSRYLPIRVYDYYAPGKQSCLNVVFANKYFFQMFIKHLFSYCFVTIFTKW